MVWSRNDSWMVTADQTGYVKYWQSNMNNVKMFQAHKEPVRAIRCEFLTIVYLLVILFHYSIDKRTSSFSINFLLIFTVNYSYSISFGFCLRYSFIINMQYFLTKNHFNKIELFEKKLICKMSILFPSHFSTRLDGWNRIQP